VFTVVAPADGEAAVVLVGNNSGLVVSVMEEVNGACQASNCLAGGSTAAIFPMTAGQIYFVAVDGPIGALPDFTLDLNCATN